MAEEAALLANDTKMQAYTDRAVWERWHRDKGGKGCKRDSEGRGGAYWEMERELTALWCDYLEQVTDPMLRKKGIDLWQVLEHWSKGGRECELEYESEIDA